MKKLYFAYGSNLDSNGMKRRCPHAIKRGPMIVPNLALVFRGVADVTTRAGAWTYGGLWEITDRCEQALDRYEGFPHFYTKRYFFIRHEHEKSERVMFYQMMKQEGIMPPGDRYLQILVEGYKNFGLPLDILDKALHEAWGDKEITPYLAERRERRGENMAKSLKPVVKVVPTWQQQLAAKKKVVLPVKTVWNPPKKIHGVSGTSTNNHPTFDDYIKSRQVKDEVRLIKKADYETWEKDRLRTTNQYKKD